jgi:hypothetical protein
MDRMLARTFDVSGRMFKFTILHVFKFNEIFFTKKISNKGMMSHSKTEKILEFKKSISDVNLSNSRSIFIPIN